MPFDILKSFWSTQDRLTCMLPSIFFHLSRQSCRICGVFIYLRKNVWVPPIYIRIFNYTFFWGESYYPPKFILNEIICTLIAIFSYECSSILLCLWIGLFQSLICVWKEIMEEKRLDKSPVNEYLPELEKNEEKKK